MTPTPVSTPKGAFLLPSLLLTSDRVSSASSEYGLIPGSVESDAANQGYLILNPSGTPTTALTMDLKLQRGGNPTGYATPIDGTPGASIIGKPTSATSSQWRGYNDTIYLTYARNILGATVSSDYPGFSRPRELGNGSLGFCYLNRDTTPVLKFAYKASRTDGFTHVTILTSGSPYTLVDDCAPDFVVLPSGRLVCFFGVSGLASEVIAYYSDNHGATWALWSLDTFVPLSSARMLCAEYTQGAICLVVGRSAAGSAINPKIYWSADGGQSFSYTDTFTGGVPATTVSATGQVILACDDTTSPNASVYIYSVGIGAGADQIIASGTVAAAAPVHTLVTRDDGVLFGFNGGIYGPSSYIRARISLDHGQSWHGYEFASGTSLEILGYNGYSSFNRGWRTFRAGSWAGQIVVLAGTKGATSSLDDSLQELYFGGWDDLTEAPKGAASGLTPGYASPEGGIYLASDTPDAFGWTKNDVGAGATIALGNDGLSITATAVNNSNYTAPSTIFSTGATPAEGSVRMRFWFKWGGTGTGLVPGRSHLLYSVGDGVNRQWFTVNFGPDQMSIRDNTGQLAVCTSVSNQFTAWTEVFVAFRHDYPSAGSGKASVWYRIAGSAYWTALATNQTIAEEAGVATQELSFGGTVGGACTWYIAGLTFATDDNGLVGGFTNPTDLAGRPVPPLADMQLVYGLRLKGAGHLGVKGDTYDLATAYSYPATRLVESLSPSSFWRSSADNTDVNVVFACGVADIFEADTVAIFGTNFRTATLQAHSSDSWGSPSVSISLDATIKTISGISAGMRGRIRLNASELTPHQYRSTEGNRWYVEIAGTSTTVYEITDNDADTILVEGVDFTTLAGTEILRIFIDRMSAQFGRFGYRYMRLFVSSQDTSAGYYRAGTLVIGKRVEISTPYAQGFRERTDYRIQVTEGVAGQRWMSKRGPQRRTLEIAWDPLYRPLQPWTQALQAIHDASEGALRGVVHWRDMAKANDVRLYTIKTPFVLENIHNEGREAMDRPAQVTLEEVL